MEMLRRSIPLFKIGLIVLLAGGALYFYSEIYGRYILGIGMMLISVALVFYILFMFKRYGEKTRAKIE
ncbi:hypothetical protein BCY91_15845 [Pelobium manganitolerans]|uniref:Uncharacterized protein n=1 Tax=Pelobium manganitolerans TaxID=1842495 RepID=A0A419S8S5_9SPHI|nr:hypothetical protein [Pelobium manganitolerans]RKD18273.1 hypothetical protein BCY91_15845 [Pelobium manganitolerans]